MAHELTSLQLRKTTKKRFKAMLLKDKKKNNERHFYTDDFIIRLLDHYESSQS